MNCWLLCLLLWSVAPQAVSLPESVSLTNTLSVSAPAPPPQENQLRQQPSTSLIPTNTVGLILFTLFVGGFLVFYFVMRSIPSEKELKARRMKKE